MTEKMGLHIKGKVWKFGNDINTDLILPNRAYFLSVDEQPKYVFSANRPGWVEEVQPGDIIVGGKNFGMGSSRPAARSLKNLGIGCLIADSINGLFYRNSINWGFPALECPGVYEAFEEGNIAEVSFEKYSVLNLISNRTIVGKKTPTPLLEILSAGGIYPLLEREGLIAPKEIQ